MQVSFPRGGGSDQSSSHSQKRGRESGQEDGLFGSKRLRRIEVAKPSKISKGKGKAKRKQSSQTSSTTIQLMQTLGLGMVLNAESPSSTKIEKMSMKKYSTGSLALGYVLQVHSNHLIISLPGGLTGMVDFDDVSDYFHQLQEGQNQTRSQVTLPSLTTLFSLWQPVSCYVHGLKERLSSKSEKSFIKLSLRSSLFNKGLALKHLTPGFVVSGCVSSVEDHGYVVDLGINGVTSFLPIKRVPQSFRPLQLGQLLTCMVEDLNEISRVVTLRIQKKAISKATIQISNLAFLAIRPGMMFNVIVDKAVENGLIVNFLSSFSGVIDCFSLPEPMTISKMKSTFSTGEVLIARIVFVDHASKSVRFSLRPHVINLEAPHELPPLGSYIENLTVTVIQKQEGLLLNLQQPEIVTDINGEVATLNDDTIGTPPSAERSASNERFVNLGVCLPRRKLEDPATGEAVIENTSISKLFKEGMVISKVRVLGYHLVEGWISGSNISQFLNEDQVLHISNIVVGDMYNAQITSIRPDGLVILIENKLPGFCPSLHLSDAGIMSKLSKLYHVHQTINVRVWDIDDKNIIASCKKSVLQEDRSGLLLSFDDAIKGRIALGVVSKLSAEDGIRVHFCNGIKGYVPNDILTKQGIFDLSDSYQIGQTVRCMIIDKESSDSAKTPRLVLALAIGDISHLILPAKELEVESKEDVASRDMKSADGCDIVSGYVTKAINDELTLRLSDGRTAIIPKYQCFDFAATADKIFQTTFSVGSYLPEVLILSSNKKVVFASIKPLFLKISITENDAIPIDSLIPSSISDLVPGQIVVGWVFKVESYGVLVRFRGNLTALAPRTCLADKFVSSPIGMFSVGDSVRCIVQQVDAAGNRTIITLKPSLVPTSTGNINFCRAFLSERFLIGLEVSKQSSVIIPDWKKYPLGSIVEAKIVEINNGVKFIADDATTMMAASSEHIGNISMMTVNSSIRVRVLDIDYENFVLVVSCLPHLTTEQHGKKKQSKSKKSTEIEHFSKLAANIEVVHEKYLIVSIERNSQRHLVFVTNADYNSPALSTSSYRVRGTLDICIDVSPSSKINNPYDTVYFGHIIETTKEFQLKLSASMREEALTAANDDVDYGKLKIGAIIPWEVREITPLEVKLKPAVENSTMSSFASVTGSLHISCAVDQITGCDNISSTSWDRNYPFEQYQVGSRIYCRTMKVQIILNNHRSRSNSISSESNYAEEIDTREDRSKDSILVYVALAQSLHHRSLDHEIDEKNNHKYRVYRPLVQWHAFGCIQLHQIYATVITKIDKFTCNVSFSPYVQTTLSYMDVSKDPKIIQYFIDHCFIGQRILVLVTELDLKRKYVQVRRIDIEEQISHPFNEQTTSNLANQTTFSISTSTENVLQQGSVVYGLLDLKSKILRSPAATINLPFGRFGRLCITEFDEHENWNEDYLTINTSVCEKISCRGFVHGQLVTCVVLSHYESSKESNAKSLAYELSIRPSRLSGSLTEKIESYPTAGAVIKAFIINISNKGCFVRVSHNIVGHVLMRDLSDSFVEDPSATFPPGKLVKCRVLSSNAIEKKVQLSLKESVVNGGEKLAIELSELRINQVVTGAVTKVTEFGVFVSIDGTSLVGLSRLTDAVLESGKTKGQDLRDVYNDGDIVRAKILSIAPGTNKISLGLKPSYFKNEESDLNSHDNEEADTDDEEVDVVDTVVQHQVDEKTTAYQAAIADITSVKAIGPTSSSERKTFVGNEDLHPNKKRKQAIDTVESKESSGLQSIHTISMKPSNNSSSIIEWDDFAPVSIDKSVDQEDVDENTNEFDQASTNHRSRQKKAKRRREEQSIREREEALTEGNVLPENKDDYERLLLSQPNSSFLWIQYMAFHLASADIVAARAIAERALRTINFREEDEKLNVWLAWLNLEYKFGTAESIDQTYRRAVNESQGKYLHLRLAESLEQDQRHDQCQEIFENALKKYKYSKKVWMAYQHYYLRKNLLKEAKALLTRSMQSLAKHKHVEVIMKFALCEYDVGFIHDGRYLFEELLVAYPKRSDLWHVYVDREIKCGDYNYARQIFERMTAAKTSVRNMKVVFKKYLDFEQKYGNINSQEAVKQKARDYVESLMS